MEVITTAEENDEMDKLFVNDNEDPTEEKKTEKEQPCNSFLALLDDKNRSISLLKQQIHNQKVQLGFYLHRVLNSNRVMQLAESCTPYETEENIQINLAMNKFCKQTGLKSRIMELHSRMFDMEKRILRMIQEQEDMLRAVVTRFVEIAENTRVVHTAIQLQPNEPDNNSDQVEMLSCIFNSTNKLRKELETFRICCNRLIVIEDERNSLVEHVYSLPVTHRMSYGVILAAQYEKMRLEKEVKEIKCEQLMLKDRLTNLRQNASNSEFVVGDCVDPPIPRVKSSTSQNTLDLKVMLDAVATEAVSFLAVAQEQKEKYIMEIAQLKEENASHTLQIKSLLHIAQEKCEFETKLVKAITDYRVLKEDHKNQIAELTIRLQTVVEENEKLQTKLQEFNKQNEEIKLLLDQVANIETVQRQRDYFKSQVADLQAIRAAYAQLVEHRSSQKDEEKQQELASRNDELEKERNNMSKKVQSLEVIIDDQETQIKHLLIIIDGLGNIKNDEKESSARADLFKQTENVGDTISRHANTKMYYMKDSGYTSESKSAYSRTNTTLENSTKQTMMFSGSSKDSMKKDKSTIRDWTSDYIHNVYSSSNRNYALENPRSSEILLTQAEEQFNDGKDSSIPPHAFFTNSLISTTSVEVQAVNPNGKSESLKAVLETSSPLEGVIQINNSSALSVKVTYGGGSKQQKSQTTSTNAITLPPAVKSGGSIKKTTSGVIDEFELMKDSSKETIVANLPSNNRRLNSLVAVQCVGYKCTKEEAVDDDLSVLNMDDDVSFQTITNRHLSGEEEEQEIDENPFQICSEEDIETEKMDISDAQGVKLWNEPAVHEDKTKKASSNNSLLKHRLQLITKDLEKTLAQPGGKDKLLVAVKDVYTNSFHSSNGNKIEREM